MAVMKWARASDHRKIFHLATSFGASVTLLAALRLSFADLSAVVFWNPVINYRNTFIKPKVEWASEFFDQKSEEELAFRPGTTISDSDFVIGPAMTMELMFLTPERTDWPPGVPLLVIYGDADTSVPFSDAEEYAEINSPIVNLVAIQGADHGFDSAIGDVVEQTLRWFQQYS